MTQQALQKFEQPKVAAPDVNEFAVMKETSSMLVKTGFLPQTIKTPEQAIAIILTGRELGIGTMAALNTINVIQGKPTISPQLMLALIERSGQLADIQIETGKYNVVNGDKSEGYACTMKRKGRSPHTEYFGDAEAKAMGLDGKDNYKKQKMTMYRWRVLAACARVVFPDVILGLYTPDEMGAEVNDDGEILPPVKDNLRALPNHTIDGELVEEAKPLTISEICKQLKAAGDEVDWNRNTLHEYAQELFGTEYNGFAALTDTQKAFLAEDLGERLKQFQAQAAATA